MFDDIGTAQRQGCAVFSNSFISDPRPGDPHSDQAVQRLRFWTAVHEIGHTFNLAHSWQKNLGPTSPGTRLTTCTRRPDCSPLPGCSSTRPSARP